jgi:hypothetical protein
MKGLRQQAGMVALVVIVSIALVLVASIALQALQHRQRDAERYARSEKRLETIQRSLAAFVASNNRMPCPANGAAGTGVSDPDGAIAFCLSPTGIVPWRTLGISRDQALDEWGNFVSYRVFDTGIGLTQAGGASMAACDTIEATPVGPDANGLCRATLDTMPGGRFTLDTFLFNKGFQLNDEGTFFQDVAYVLISHGATGRGAFASGNAQGELPTPGGDEARNLQAAGPFTKRATTPPGTDPAAPAHFDDLIAYESVANLIARAGTGARDWP